MDLARYLHAQDGDQNRYRLAAWIWGGDKVVMYYGAANRDPERFENPHQLNLGREGERHIAFGGGHHVCLGQWFARFRD